MTIFQVILLAVFLSIFFYAFRFRSVLTERLLLVGLAVVGFLLTLAPDSATLVANFLGVGRGTDLILYVWILVFIVKALSDQAKFREYDRRITDLVRRIALQNAQPVQEDEE